MKQWIGTILLCFGLLNSVLAAELLGVSPQELSQLQQRGAVLVDIRTPEEWRKTGLIPGSQPLMFFDASGKSDPAAWLQQLDKLSPGKSGNIVLICRSGHRSEQVGNLLAKTLGYEHVYHLKSGLKGWVEQGQPTTACRSC